ncbi:hypothetical protein Pint_18343 [Pistacia integerrima]|uniref:Uncharacterized protein n=1 Tax=Pistacia integerrima TaxID=434235 RepID=A0ACC0YUF4_9ROSI|nr:hypothetical protein Pint_18343 [Pistacia integerrima]
MARKRKHDSKTTEPTEPPQKQLQQEPSKQEQQTAAEEPEPEKNEDVEYEEVEEVEKEGEEEEEEEEEGEGEEEEEEEENDDENQETANTSGADQDDDDDEEPIEKLLEPFSKDQLVNLLREAAEKNSDVANRIREVADEDPAHRKIFVHGLGWDTKAETLIDAFKQYGDIEDCKAVVDKVSGKSKGYGFILFKTRSGARKALKEPQKKIGSRMTSCQLASVGPVATPSATNMTQHHHQQQQPQTVSEYTQRKIFVSNVSAELDPQKLLEFFSKFGEIEEGPLGLDKVTGKPKGFCLFVYRTVEAAKKALEEPHKNYEGHVLHCQKAVDGPKPGKSQHRHHQNAQNSHFQRNDNAGYVGAAARPGHLMAPSGPGVGAAAAQALNPAIGQALTAILATQGAGLGINPALGQALLGLGSAAGAGAGMQGGYPNQAVSPGVMTGYGNQGGYPNQQMAQGGSGRGQHGVNQYGGAPYMGH